jgi:hypothetical protein
MRTVGLIALVLWLAVMLMGRVYSGEVDLEKAKELPEVVTVTDNYTKSLTPIVEAYCKVLNNEEEAQTKKGDLDILEKIKAERDNIGDVETSGAKWGKNKTLATAQKKYIDDRAKAKKDYISKLEGVQKKFVQDKKIEEAKVVKGKVTPAMSISRFTPRLTFQ